MNDIAVKQETALQTESAAIINVIEKAAMNPDVNIEKMERLLDMQERILKRNAEQAYSIAMKNCQLEMPAIVKDAENQQTNSLYAKLENIVKKITPVYTKHGFALSFGTAKSDLDDHVRITCEVIHEQGHKKDFYYDLPLDHAGIKGTINKTKVHATSSSTSYARRYLTILIFNLTIVGQDDDGNAAGGDTRTVIDVENWWIDHMSKLRELIPSINSIKEGIATNNLSMAIEAWQELTNDEKTTLWNPAPTKGGILTTQERTVIKSNEWAEKRKEIFQGENNDQ